MIKTKMKYLKNPLAFIQPLGAREMLNWMTDEHYLSLVYKSKFKKKLNLDNPKTFNEKLQWLKLYDRNPEYTKLVDKYAVREYIADSIGENFLIPLIGVYNSSEEINWDELPKQFVLKCTHGSSTNIICQDKDKLDKKETEKLLNKWLETNWYWYGREWPYKNVKPKIIIEKFMVDESGYELKDYKFFCFNGEPKLLQVDFNREVEHRKNLYDLEWNLLDFEFNAPKDPYKKIEKPVELDKMIEFAELLSSDFPYVRVDFYSINNKIYFGEMTFYPASGFGQFTPDTYDELLGSWIQL